MRRMIERYSLTLTLACVFGFLAATMIPTAPWATSRVSFMPDGGIRILSRSLLVTDAGRPLLDAPPYVEGRFAIELVMRPAHTELDGPARIVAYSRTPDVQNWIVGQRKRDLAIRHRRREARFPEMLEGGVRRHFLASLENGQVTLHRDGRRVGVQPLVGSAKPWDPDCRFGLGNEVTGDRPWIGDILAFRIYDRPLGTDEAERLYRQSGGPSPAAQLAWGAARDETCALLDRSGLREPLRVVPPWSFKLEAMIAGDYLRPVGWGDALVNMLGTIPLGFFFAALLRRRRPAVALGAVALGQGVLSLAAEIAQIFTSARFSDLTDVVANIAGAVLGALLWRFYARA